MQGRRKDMQSFSTAPFLTNKQQPPLLFLHLPSLSLSLSLSLSCALASISKVFMAMAADLGRGQAMDLRRALQDGRVVLAGGPGLGSQMILFRNDLAASMAPQHAPQATAGSEEFHHYSFQGFAGQYEDPNNNVDADVGVPGLMPPEPSRAMVVPAPSAYAPSSVPHGLGFHNMEYVAGLQASMQPYPHAQTNPGIVANAEASLHSAGAPQGFYQQNSSIFPSAESTLMSQTFIGQQHLAGFSTPGAFNLSQGSSLEDERRLAMIHEYGNGSISHQQHPMPHFQTGYQHPGQVLPVSANQVSPHPQTYTLDLEMQRMREIEMQNIWRNHLDLQRPNYQYFQQQGKNLHHRSANNPFKIRKGNSFSKHFQKSAMKKKPKPPPVAGPGGPGWCNVCQADCNTADILQQHITGKRHQKKLQQLEKEEKDAAQKKSVLENLKQIATPDKDVTDAQYKSEFGLSEGMLTETPGSSLGPDKLNDDNAEEPSVEPSAKRPRLLRRKGHSKESQPKIPPSFERCEICNVTCNNKLVLESHLSGKKHAAKVKKLPEEIQSNNASNHPKGEGDQIEDEIFVKQKFVSVSDTEKSINNTSADDLTILKDIAVLPNEPITLTEKDDDVKGLSEPCLEAGSTEKS